MVNEIYYQWLGQRYGAEVMAQARELPVDLMSDLYWEVCCFGPAGSNVVVAEDQIAFLMDENKAFFTAFSDSDEANPFPLLRSCHTANAEFIRQLQERAAQKWSPLIQEAVFKNLGVYAHGVAEEHFRLQGTPVNPVHSLFKGVEAFFIMMACQELFIDDEDSASAAYYCDLLNEVGLISATIAGTNP